MIRKIAAALIASFALSSAAWAYSCASDCGQDAEFRYRCPTFSKPGRMCTGRDPIRFAACEAARNTDCNTKIVDLMGAGHECLMDVANILAAGAECAASLAADSANAYAACLAVPFYVNAAWERCH